MFNYLLFPRNSRHASLRRGVGSLGEVGPHGEHGGAHLLVLVRVHGLEGYDGALEQHEQLVAVAAAVLHVEQVQAKVTTSSL